MSARLLALVVASLALLLAVFAWLGRDGRATRVSAAQAGEARAPATVRAAALEPARAAAGRSSTDARPAQPEPAVRGSAAPPGAIHGRIALDGRAPPEGTLVRVSASGSATSAAFALDSSGRFHVEGVAPGASTLSFVWPALDGRLVLAPQRTVVIAPGATREVELEWRSRHVNLKVTGDPGGWNRARVQLAGPATAAELETDDEGRASLTLLEAGTFRLRAVHASGRAGSTVLELADDSDLESAVIHLAR